MDQPASNAVLITEMALWAHRTLGHLILAGVFERYPTLRFVPTEQGTLWVPPQLGMLDAMVPTMKSEAHNRTYGMFGGSSVDALTMTPSEYAKRNCYLASELAPFDSRMIDFMGAEHIMWGSDYPHEEGFTPHSKLAIRWALHNRSGRLPKDPGRQRRSAVPVRPRSTGAGRRQDRADGRRGAHAARGHRVSCAGGFRLPAVRRRDSVEATGSGPQLVEGHDDIVGRFIFPGEILYLQRNTGLLPARSFRQIATSTEQRGPCLQSAFSCRSGYSGHRHQPDRRPVLGRAMVRREPLRSRA